MEMILLSSNINIIIHESITFLAGKTQHRNKEAAVHNLKVIDRTHENLKAIGGTPENLKVIGGTPENLEVIGGTIENLKVIG